MDVCAVVVVGAEVSEVGALSRLGGVPLVVRSVRAVLSVVEHATVLVPAHLRAPVAEACTGLPVAVRRSVDMVAQRSCTTGGDGSLTPRVLLVHDAARPLAPRRLFRSVLDAARDGHAAVVPVLPVSDTVKEVDVYDRVRATPDRARLRVVQTPQAFDADLAPGVLAAAAANPVQGWAGLRVHAVGGDPLAFPVHCTWDLELASSTLGS